MGSFDITKAAAIITSSDSPVLDVLGVSFGTPVCVLDFAKGLLSALPSSTLSGFSDGIKEGKEKANQVVAEFTRNLFLESGMVEFDTTTGRFIWVGTSSEAGLDAAGGDSLGILNFLGQALGVGAQAWLIGDQLMDQIDGIKNCFDKIKTYDALAKGDSGVAAQYVGFTATDPNTGEEMEFLPPLPPEEAASLVYAAGKAQLEVAVGFIEKCDQQLRVIGGIQLARNNDPAANPEPVFNGDARNANGERLCTFLSGTNLKYECDLEVDASGRPIYNPSGEFNPYLDIITLSGLMPPVSRQGQFLFSKTGMYYDSYGGGLSFPEDDIASIVSAVYFDKDGSAIPGTGVPSNAIRWMMDYNPNLGGKGTIVSLKTYNAWANTVFDLDQIDESPNLQQYYDNDHFLQVLLDQRNKEVYDISSALTQMIDSGDYSLDSAYYQNQQANLLAAASTHKKKINKRKKQIQVIVSLSSDGRVPTPGNIPINNFSILADSKIGIEKNRQENLFFNPAEVSGVVLPISPSYVTTDIPSESFISNDLFVGEVGVGGILSSDNRVSGVSGTVLSLTDQITTDGLVAVYNFLDADIVKPDSNEYLVINCSTSGANEKPAQLVASSIPSLYPSGLGIPYFRGICNLFSGIDGNPKAERHSTNDEYLYSPYKPYGYARLQGGWDDIDSLLYKRSGFSFQTWVHVPDLGTSTGEGWAADQSVSALHRVILGCENRGGTATTTNPNLVVGPQESGSVKGLLLGFSRDRRLAQSVVSPANNPSQNDLNDGLVFYMAPTQSINTSSITFLNVSANTAFCEGDKVSNSSGYYGVFVDTSTTVNNEKIDDCSTSFKLITVTVDYGKDKVGVYCNQSLLKEQTVHETFGGGQGPPRLPTVLDPSSLLYSNVYENELPWFPPRFPPEALGQQDFWYWDGPQAAGGNMPFTPWILGGGYTDGMTANNFEAHTPQSNEGMNFLGGKYGGKKSGLFGFLGSVKLYNRAITSGEVINNYQAQRGFFENIQL